MSASAVSLWDSLHDAEIVSIHSDLLDRSMTISIEIEHLSKSHQLGAGFTFTIELRGVQSARVVRYAIWPGGCHIPDGISRDEESKIVEEYQAKWREESASWNEFESGITRANKQKFGLCDAAVVKSQSGATALKLCGHMNHETYHELFLRFETLEISGTDDKQIQIEEFQRMGERYWESR